MSKHLKLLHTYFFFPFAAALFLEAAALEALDATLEARETDVELALLAVVDLTLSSVLFCNHSVS